MVKVYKNNIEAVGNVDGLLHNAIAAFESDRPAFDNVEYFVHENGEATVLLWDDGDEHVTDERPEEKPATAPEQENANGVIGAGTNG